MAKCRIHLVSVNGVKMPAGRMHAWSYFRGGTARSCECGEVELLGAHGNWVAADKLAHAIARA